MTDAAPLLAKKVLGALRPINQAAADAFAALDDRPVRVRITQTRGNTRRNGLYWAVLGVAAPMLDEKAPGLTVDLLHKVLKDRYGLVKIVTLPSGEQIKDYESISFATMTEPERAGFITWALDTVSHWLGVTTAELIEEGQHAA